ncbi:hypothetical protein CBF23_009700 [Marinomonas agarivorans]|nr:hypothetical protein CBF23_009700 [Marinomonas agarivorans]
MGLAKLLIAYSLGGLAIFSTAYASTPQAEIDHLLSFVATTECQYERNGTLHDATAAVNHIKKKYDYFIDDIATAEDFIEYAATKSSFSGKFYKIHCHGVPAVKSNAWLTDELKRFRDANQ